MDYKIIQQREHACRNEEFENQIMEQFSLSEMTSRFLVSKGFATIGQVEEYIFPKTEHLHSPMLFNQMQRVIDRINIAVERSEKIVIYGDYDCDGVCATAILALALKQLHADVECYLPDRFSDGYGMNKDALSNIVDRCGLIITVDNGITAKKEIDFVSERGVDVIITDHHTCPDELPNAYAILNPKMVGERYPFEDLCGAGVAYKLACALLHDRVIEDDLIALAAIGTIADLVGLVGENRTIASLGIKRLQQTTHIGLKKLIEVCSLKQNSINSGNVAFQIAPRINAVGRLYHANQALQLLMTNQDLEASTLASQLNEANEERKNIEETLFNIAEEWIQKENSDEKRLLMIPIENAHEGVIGIVAGKLCEKYNKAIVMMSESEGVIKGSARSGMYLDIYEVLSSATIYFEKFGGHQQAAGFTITKENLDDLLRCTEEYLSSMESGLYKYQKIYYDFDAVSSQITEKSVNEMNLFAPYGMKNPHPVYRLEDVQIKNITTIGKNKDHIKCNIMHKSMNFQGIGFSMGNISEKLKDQACTYDILFVPSLNHFRNRTTIQLQLKDIQINHDSIRDYEISLYKHFMRNYTQKEGYVPSEEQIFHISREDIIEKKDAIIVYTRDILKQVLRYCHVSSIPHKIHYTEMKNYGKDKLNIIVNPIHIDEQLSDEKIYVLDEPYFSFYEKDLYENITKVQFYGKMTINNQYRINRKYIVNIYKKIRILKNIGNNIFDFIDLLNTESEYMVDYFSLRISLDVLTEMEIIEYEVIRDQIYVNLLEIREQKDINESHIMIKLSC